MSVPDTYDLLLGSLGNTGTFHPINGDPSFQIHYTERYATEKPMEGDASQQLRQVIMHAGAFATSPKKNDRVEIVDGYHTIKSVEPMSAGNNVVGAYRAWLIG